MKIISRKYLGKIESWFRVKVHECGCTPRDREIAEFLFGKDIVKEIVDRCSFCGTVDCQSTEHGHRTKMREDEW